MSVERIAVATAVISTALSAGSLLLSWYRGSTRKRPRLARALGAVALGSSIVLIVALGVASGGGEDTGSPAARSLSADEYRGRLIAICDGHRRESRRVEEAEGARPVFGTTVQLETRTLDRIDALSPPPNLATDHRAVLALWGRRVSLLGHYYERYRQELDEPSFRREFRRALKRIDALTRDLTRLLVALKVTPECDLFT